MPSVVLLLYSIVILCVGLIVLIPILLLLVSIQIRLLVSVVLPLMSSIEENVPIKVFIEENSLIAYLYCFYYIYILSNNIT